MCKLSWCPKFAPFYLAPRPPRAPVFFTASSFSSSHGGVVVRITHSVPDVFYIKRRVFNLDIIIDI